MPKIVRFHATGDADVLKIEDLPLAEPGDGEVRLKVQDRGYGVSKLSDVRHKKGADLFSLEYSRQGNPSGPHSALCTIRFGLAPSRTVTF